MAFEDEWRLDNVTYRAKRSLAIGELNAACKECVVMYPVLAQITREHLLAFQRNNDPIPTEYLITLANDIEDSEEKEDEKEIEPEILDTELD